jgi:molybdopterin converting factor small subunit
MTIEVRIFGDLKEKMGFDKGIAGTSKVLNLEASQFKTISDILNEFSIDEDEVSHIFVNYTYSSTKKEIKDGDRVGLFPRNMALLYKWYFSKED